MIYHFTIKGNPKPKQSVRFTKTGHKYQPKELIQEEKNIRSQIIEQLPKNFELLKNGIELSIVFYFPPLKTFNKKIMNDIENGKIIPKTTKPDLDNLEKMILDAMQGVVYLNDSQIYCKASQKYYSLTPQINITIEER